MTLFRVKLELKMIALKNDLGVKMSKLEKIVRRLRMRLIRQ